MGYSLVVTTAMSLFGFQMITGIAGILFYFGFLYVSLTSKEPEPVKTNEDSQDIESGGKELPVEEEEEHHNAPTWKGIAFLCAGGVLIFSFSGPFINRVVLFAEYLEVNPILLAFFLGMIK